MKYSKSELKRMCSLNPLKFAELFYVLQYENEVAKKLLMEANEDLDRLKSGVIIYYV